jgi:hypothetical protein
VWLKAPQTAVMDDTLLAQRIPLNFLCTLYCTTVIKPPGFLRFKPKSFWIFSVLQNFLPE